MPPYSAFTHAHGPGPLLSSDSYLPEADRPGTFIGSRYHAYLSSDSTPTVDSFTEKKPNRRSFFSNAPNQDEADEYPKGWAFAFIVVALVMSVFLVSLDMVSILLPYSCEHSCGFN